MKKEDVSKSIHFLKSGQIDQLGFQHQYPDLLIEIMDLQQVYQESFCFLMIGDESVIATGKV